MTKTQAQKLPFNPEAIPDVLMALDDADTAFAVLNINRDHALASGGVLALARAWAGVNDALHKATGRTRPAERAAILREEIAKYRQGGEYHEIAKAEQVHDKEKRGNYLAHVLGLKANRENGRYNTAWGNKTSLGLYETVARIVSGKLPPDADE